MFGTVQTLRHPPACHGSVNTPQHPTHTGSMVPMLLGCAAAGFVFVAIVWLALQALL